ncbi:nuclear transport factor 2 family protein [Paenibacillus humicola]|uniref:nuclear transport factor 2 family protein n=1 Tax=Paenibacillus humicola TaxID=3110540 RepID=UPI00237C3C17|nr:nuclear transport factor 2 family protein [Paenibacillus humicola]
MLDNQDPISWINKLAITETVSKFAWFADNREWEALEQLFTEEVKIDYTSLTGGEPATIPANALMNSWKQGLTPLKATQHFLSNPIVDLDSESQATCRAYFQARHEYPNPFGESQWTLGGTYTFRFASVNGQWKISGLVMTAVWASGNQNIMNLAVQQQQ